MLGQPSGLAEEALYSNAGLFPLSFRKVQAEV